MILRGVFRDTNVFVDRVICSVPLYFVGGLLDGAVGGYFVCPARAFLSPSSLRDRSAAIASLIEACEDLLPAHGAVWTRALPELLGSAPFEADVRRIVAAASEFLDYLVIEKKLSADVVTQATSAVQTRPPRGRMDWKVRGAGASADPGSPSVTGVPLCSAEYDVDTKRHVSAFPEHLIQPFFRDGMRRGCVAASRRARTPDQWLAAEYNLVPLLYFLQLCFGCMRGSEPLHEWVGDVRYDFERDSGAIIDIWHPSLGPAPHRADGSRRNRAEFLFEEFGLCPRKFETGTRRVGWKNLFLDEDVPGGGSRTRVHWLSADVGKLYWRLHQSYLSCVRPLTSRHPFLFSSRSNRSTGTPWTLDSAEDAFDRALSRIEKVPSASEGLTIHGFRHRGRLWMEAAGVSAVNQQKVLHQHSIASQNLYGRTNPAETTEILRDAQVKLGFRSGTHFAPQEEGAGMAERFLGIGRSLFEHFMERYDDLS